VDHPGTGDLALDQGVRRGGGAFCDEALAGAKDNREDQQAVLVDQPSVGQGARELPAAVHLQFPAGPVLERRHGVDDIG
jgi:hypothetical protein